MSKVIRLPTASEEGSPVLATSCLWLPRTQNPGVQANLQETLVIYCDTPPSCDPSIPLSTRVTLCPWTDVVLRGLTQSCTLSHCSGRWPAAPPGRMASLLNHNPVILPELSFQRAQPSLCTAPTSSSWTIPNLLFFLVHEKSFSSSVSAVAHRLFFLTHNPHLIPFEHGSLQHFATVSLTF